MAHNLENKIQALESELRKRDQIIEHLHKDAILAQVVPEYLHEIRVRFSTLSMYLTQLFHACYSNETAMSLIPRVTEQFEALRELHDSFLSLARNQQTMEAIALTDCLQESVTTFEPRFRGERITLSVTTGEKASHLQVPRFEFRLILVNLLSNALTALRRVRKEQKSVSIEVSSDENDIKLSITDNGSGIPRESLDDIWSPYFTTWPQKVGLGLYVDRSMVERYGGKVSVNSKVGEFTRLTVSIPLQWKERVRTDEKATLDR